MKTPASRFILTGVLTIVFFASSSYTILQSSLPNQLSAFATFPGENGKVAFSSLRDGNYEIYVMNADGSEQINISQDRFLDRDPDWSSDSTMIAFSSDRPSTAGTGTEIWIMNADGSNPRQVTSNEGNDLGPSWSPDGTKIAFETPPRQGGSAIHVINADGTGQRQLTGTTLNDNSPDWSPDGTKIAFSGAHEIFVVNENGSGLTRLTFTLANDEHPSWSPDGTKIVFMSNRDGNNEIYVMNADGSEQTRLTNTPNQEMYPSWSPDGTKIVFEIRDDIYIMDAEDGSNRINLSNNPAIDVFPDWGTAEVEEDTIPPVITVPADMTVEATDQDGTQVSFDEEPSAIDNVDGPVDVTCDYNSGDTFPIGETVVTCSADDAAGNTAQETFTVTVQDTTEPNVEITQVVDRRNRALEEGDTTPTPYIRVTFQATDAVGVDNTECSLDGQGFTSCTSPVVYDRLSRGTHQVTVRATDEAGNTGEDHFTWTINNPSAVAPGRQ